VLSVVHRNASNAVLASVVYERSASGEPTKITREDGTYTRVEYDSALRVSKESSFDANGVLVAETQYGYDLDGNRTSKTTLTESESYSYAAGFKLTGISGTGGSEVYGHDAGGRLTSIDRGGVHRVMEYDSMDHITRVTDGGLEVERYTFDGTGRRVGVGAGASAKRFLIAPSLGDGYESPQAVTDGSGNVIATYVYAGEHPIMRIGAGGQVEYLLADSMGSVIGKASGAGASTASIKYTAFGEVASAVGASAGIDSAVGAEPRFHGMTLDAGTGLYFVRARTYDSRTGRFVSRDPVDGITREPERNNPYTFANSNPQRWSDPTGLFTLADISAAGVVAAELATIAIARAGAHFLFVLSAAAVGTTIGWTYDAAQERAKDRANETTIDIGIDTIRRQQDRSSTYLILQGVRRAKSAQLLGMMTIAAIVEGAGVTVQQLPLDSLLSPKPVIDVRREVDAKRFSSRLEEVRNGEFAPIVVIPSNRGTPLRDVQIVYGVGGP
jgi:RHS repeat-associated protein